MMYSSSTFCSSYSRCGCTITRWEISHHLCVLNLWCLSQDPRGRRRHYTTSMYSALPHLPFAPCTLVLSHINSVLCVLRRLISDGQSTSLISPCCCSGRCSTRPSCPIRTSRRTLWSSRYVTICFFYVTLNNRRISVNMPNEDLKISFSQLNCSGYLRDQRCL